MARRHSRFTSIGSVVVLAVTAVVCLAPAAAASDGRAGRIAFSRQSSDGDARAYVIGARGSGEQLVRTPYPLEYFARAVWSHDSRRLLVSALLHFDNQGELLPFRPAIAHPDRPWIKLLDPPGFGFDMSCNAWSRHDARILCGAGDVPGVWSMRASDGTRAQRITTNPYGMGELPVGYSPDGTQIAFIRFRSADPSGGDHSGEAVALFLARPDGTDLRQLTEYGLLMGHEIASASWSPDGRHIISSSPNGRLVVIDTIGRGVHWINVPVGAAGHFAFTPTYSPDGRNIAFAMKLGAASDIYTARVDGSHLTQLTRTEAPELFRPGDHNRIPWSTGRDLVPPVRRSSA